MEHLRFCGSLNIACGYAGEQGFCTLTRCPVVLDEFQAMRRHQGPTGPKGRPGICDKCGSTEIFWDSKSDVFLCLKCGCSNAGGNMKKSTCRGCGAPIVWIRTAAGKSMPCDAQPVLYKAREGAAGKIVTGNGTVLSADIGGLAAFEPDGVGHVSHFATCPAAEQFRRKGGDGRRNIERSQS